MALIELNIPEEEGWRDSLATRVMLVMTALLLMRMGFRVVSSLYPGSLLGAASAALLFAAGTQLLIFSVSDIDLEKWGPWITWGVFTLVVVTIAVTMLQGFIARIGTDALLFSRVAVEQLVESGQNPYTIDMRPHIYGTLGPSYSTPRIDGSIVRSFSYPAGAVLAFAPQWALVGESPYGVRATLVIGAFLSCALTITMLPDQLKIAGIVVFMGARNMFLTAAGGILWPLWVLPLLLGFRAWADERWLWASAWIGLSAGTKQFAWLIIPFLALWQLKISPTWREFGRRAVRMTAVGAAAFLAFNLPFILADPVAWARGVLTPLSLQAPMVQMGSGLALLPFTGLPLAFWYHTLAVAVIGIIAVVAYWLYFEELKWAAWLAPPIILWGYSRSLMSYYTPWGVLALLGAFALWGRLQTGPLLPALRRDRHERGVVTDD